MKVQELCFIAGWNSSQLLMTSWAREMWFDAIQGVIPQFMSFASASLISFCLLPAIHFQLSSNAVPSLSWPCGKADENICQEKKHFFFFELESYEWLVYSMACGQLYGYNWRWHELQHQRQQWVLEGVPMLSDLAVNKNLLWDHILDEGVSLATVFFIELLFFILFYFIKKD